MTQIPLLSGIYTTEAADFGIAYPVNLEAVPCDNGISKGYMRSAAGAEAFVTGPGIDRGAIVWNGCMYRIMGTKLVRLEFDNTLTILGDVGGSGPVTLQYGFDRLAIRSGQSLYYWNGTTLTQVTDPDLGPCLDVAWFKGQYFSTDGNYIIATQISDPTQVDPTKYGSAESDPDMVTGLGVLRNELLAFGQNTIDIFSYTGGSGFPLTLSDGATVPIGCVGAAAKCIFVQTYAFVGAGRNQDNAVWLLGGGSAQKISTRAIDDILAKETNPAAIELEARVSRDENRLYVHLTTQTLVYLHTASQASGAPVWYIAKSGQGARKPYRLRHQTSLNGKWIVGDTETGQLGTLTDSDAHHFGEATGWRFDTQLLYNGGNSVIVHSLELVGLPGRHQQYPEPSAFFSYTLDGETYSMERANTVGRPGQRRKRVVWNIHRRFRNYMGIRFRGDSTSLQGWAALEADLESLNA